MSLNQGKRFLIFYLKKRQTYCGIWGPALYTILKAGIDYAEKLKGEIDKYKNELKIVMRVILKSLEQL
ncbi:MAG: hypothetical protein Ct9H90mP4_03110 [Gammaproteobacteria bacterium]|nr:MAG: hypothetical protein Ct9H90mP4_03110 [Gammaproteobacteria bacterium]